MMPKFIGNDSLIARVNDVEGRMYRQSNELGRLNKAVRKYKAENAKLRELVQDYDKVLSSMQALCDCDFVPLCDGTLLALRSRMYELGIEVDG